MVRFFIALIFVFYVVISAIASDELQTITTCSELKEKNNAEEIIIAYQERNDENPCIFLIGKSKAGKEIWKVQFPLADQQINLAKLTIECTEYDITFTSQLPFSAAEVWQKFSWKDSNLILTDSGSGDPSDKAVDGAIKRALNGEGVEVDEGIQYPDRYIYAERLKKAIQNGHQKALGLYKQKNLKKAIKVLGDVLEVTIKLAEVVTFVEKEDSNPYIYWADLWLRADIKEKEYVEALNDYGFFLYEDKQIDKSIEVFEAVLLFVPDRVVTYLNLADAYYEKANLQKPPDKLMLRKASEKYKKYREMMQIQNKSKRIPPRVNERIK